MGNIGVSGMTHRVRKLRIMIIYIVCEFQNEWCRGLRDISEKRKFWKKIISQPSEIVFLSPFSISLSTNKHTGNNIGLYDRDSQTHINKVSKLWWALWSPFWNRYICFFSKIWVPIYRSRCKLTCIKRTIRIMLG